MLLDDLTRAARAGSVYLDPFSYTVTYNTLGALANVPVNIQIQADSDFVITKTMLCAYTAASVFLVNPDYLVSFFDSGSGRQLQDNPVHVHNIMGTAERPFIWSEPKLIKGSSTFIVTTQNLTAVAARVDLLFHGFKVFYVPPFTRSALGAGYR